MNEENLKQFIGKRVFIVLKSSIHYDGTINGIENDYIYLIDRFGDIVFINISDISSIGSTEKKEKGGKKNG